MKDPPPVSAASSRDPLARMRAFQIADALVPDCFSDCEKLRYHAVLVGTASQLYEAVVSISANMAEGYSRAAGRDRAKFFEYSLGSAREAMTWYKAAIPLLGETVVTDRLDRLEEIRRILLAIIPRERDRLIRKGS